MAEEKEGTELASEDPEAEEAEVEQKLGTETAGDVESQATYRETVLTMAKMTMVTSAS